MRRSLTDALLTSKQHQLLQCSPLLIAVAVPYVPYHIWPLLGLSQSAPYQSVHCCKPCLAATAPTSCGSCWPCCIWQLPALVELAAASLLYLALVTLFHWQLLTLFHSLLTNLPFVTALQLQLLHILLCQSSCTAAHLLWQLLQVLLI